MNISIIKIYERTKYMNTILAGLATELSQLATKQVATTVQAKVQTMKGSSDVKKVRQTYDQLLDTLLEDRSQAIKIAQAYKEEVEKIEISDDDIKHLNNTITRLLEIFKKFIKADGKDDNPEIQAQLNSFEQLNELINVDTLKTMQLLGFNYKEAIGEPLTTILRNFILSYAPSTDSMGDFQKIVSPEMVEILKNKTAFDNFSKFMNSLNQEN